MWDGGWPSYASIITLELYETSDGHYFRLLYAGKELKLPTCSQGTSIAVVDSNNLGPSLRTSTISDNAPPASIIHQNYLRVTVHLMVRLVFDRQQPCVPCPS